MHIPLNRITDDAQVHLAGRGIDEAVVAAYAEALTAGTQFPPLAAFDDGSTLWLADGFYRLAAYRFCGIAEVEVDVRPGSRQDALIHAATVNVTNGRPMSQAEKREACERLLKLTKWSQEHIAKALAVSNASVSRWASLASVRDRETEVNRNGVTYTIDTARIGYRTAADNTDLDTGAHPVGSLLLDTGSQTNLPTLLSPPLEAPGYRLICGDFARVVQDFAPASIDVVITDPPYSGEFLPLYATLGQAAARLLKPGGSLLVMTGQYHLPDALAAMTPHLRYHWMVAYLTPGGQSPQIWPRKVNTFWKPILWLTNGESTNHTWVGDVIRSAVNDNDKQHHPWGQSVSGMAELVEKFTHPGQTILDPFCGGGTTGVAAVARRRRFIGIDCDEAAIRTTAARLAELLHRG